jgi:hypothetical protein
MLAVATLVGPDGDAHVFQSAPTDAKAVAGADVIVANGLGFEGWMERLVEASRTGAALITADEEILEMNNGCICRTVQGDPIRILCGLIKRKDFNGILTETTGMADPAPVAQTFHVDQDVAEKTRLDAIVTVVDAVNLAIHLEEAHEAAEQIAFTAWGDGRLRAFCPGAAPAERPVHRGAILSMAAEPSGTILTGGDDGRLCRVTPRGLVELAAVPRKWVDHVGAGARGAVACSAGRAVHLWDGGWRGHVNAICALPGHEAVLAGYSSGAVVFSEIDEIVEPRAVKRPTGAAIVLLIVAPLSGLLLAADQEGGVLSASLA